MRLHHVVIPAEAEIRRRCGDLNPGSRLRALPCLHAWIPAGAGMTERAGMPEARRDGGGRRAFSILEILVSIAIIAVLLSIALPALSHAIAVSRRATSRANLQTLHTIMALYSGDSDGFYPAMYPDELYKVDEGQLLNFGWWSVWRTWPTLLYDYLPFKRNRDVYFSPGAKEPPAWPTIDDVSYRYSTSFVGSPTLWSAQGEADDHFKIAQKVSDVTWASNKVLMWDSEFGSRRHELEYVGRDLAENVPMLMADGSGVDHRPSDATKAFPNPFNTGVQNLRLHNTPHGVAGRDYP